MENIFDRIRNSEVSKGGMLGALVGGLISAKSHRPGDSTLNKAGKTAAFTGLGFLLGAWVEKLFRK
jgi:hypothetical protein